VREGVDGGSDAIEGGRGRLDDGVGGGRGGEMMDDPNNIVH
jgi:hypothetical protein